MILETWVTIIFAFFTLIVGHKVFLFDRFKKLNIFFFILSIFMIFHMVWWYELSQATTIERAFRCKKFLSFRPLIDVLFVVLLWFFVGLNQLPSMKLYEKMIGFPLLVMGIALSVFNLYSNSFYDNMIYTAPGYWGHNILEMGVLEWCSGAWMFTVANIVLFIIVKTYTREKDKRRQKKILPVALFGVLSLCLFFLQNWLLPVLGYQIPLNESLHFMIGIFFFGNLFTDFKLFKINHEIAAKNIAESMTNVMILTNTSFKIEKVNQAAQSLFNREEALLKNTFLEDYFPPEQVAICKPEIENLNHIGEQYQNEYTFNTNDQPVYILMIATPVFNREKTKIGYAFVGTDLTAYKASEEKIRLYAGQLEKTNEILERFAHIASHDLKEPLRTVGSFVNLIERRMDPSQNLNINEYLKFIKEATFRMNDVIDSTMEISELRKKKSIFRKIDISQLIDRLKLSLNALIHKKNVEITVEELPTIIGDEKLIESLFQNLIINGIKYNESDQPTIYISFIEHLTFIEFAVADNGIGINEEYHQQVFQMYKRLHNRTKYSGTGVGLFYCAQIVEKHKGEIWIESDGKSGTTIKFTLPIDPSENLVNQSGQSNHLQSAYLQE